jgi:nucleoside-diphosphate-sugar epimerase
VNSEKLWPVSVLILGCGDLGRRLAEALPAEHYNLVGVRRSPPVAGTQPVPGFSYHACDVQDPSALAEILTRKFNVIVVTMTPGERSDEGYRNAYVQTCKNLIAGLARQQSPSPLILWVSSTSVYGQQDGSWVDEDSPTQPESFGGQRLLEAENLLRESGFRHCILRFSGIYGPGRTRLIDQVRQGRAVLSAAYTNRIHVDDCVGVLTHLIEKSLDGVEIEPLYIASDSCPAPMAEVVNWLAMHMKVDKAIFAPDQIDNERGNKRCSNQRLLASGYTFRYPTYQQGYGAILGINAE